MNSFVSVDKEEDKFSFHGDQIMSEADSLNGGDSCSSSAGSVVLVLPKDNVVVEASEEEASADVIPVTIDNIPVYLSRSVDGTPLYIRRHLPTMEELLLTSPDESAPSFDGFSEASGSTFEGFSEASRCSSICSGSFEGFADDARCQEGEAKINDQGASEVDRSGKLPSPLLQLNRRKSLRQIVKSSKAQYKSIDQEMPANSKKRSHEEMQCKEEGISNTPSQKRTTPKRTEANTRTRSSSDIEISPTKAKRGLSMNDRSEADADEGVRPESEDSIGFYCNQIGCTISWLESMKSMCAPVTNGVVFELSEFADRIAWERYYLAVWILRLSGYNDIIPKQDDHSKIHLILKRRKALMVTLAGQKFGHLKLQEFDELKFVLPSVIKARELDKGISDNLPNITVNDVRKSRRQRVPKPLEEIDDFVEETPLSDADVKQEPENIKVKEEIIDSQSVIDTNACSPSSNTDIDNLNSNNADTLEIGEMRDGSVKKGKGGLGISKSGRIRKPSAKGSVSIEFKYLFMEKQVPFSTSSGSENGTHLGSESPKAKKRPKQILKKIPKDRSLEEKEPKLKRKCYIGPRHLNKYVDLDSTRVDFTLEEGRIVPYFKELDHNLGPRSSAIGLTVRDLNTKDRLDVRLTNGIIKELFDFYKSRGSTISSLTCRLFWMLGEPRESARILSAVSKISTIGKTITTDDAKADKIFTIPGKYIVKNKNSDKISKPKKTVLCSKVKRLKSQVKATHSKKKVKEVKQKTAVPPDQPLDELLTVDEDVLKTRGKEGSITRGDIVYLYTQWLKNKKKAGDNVFVTDLLKDVEQLMVERKVEAIRVPAGTLMSSSVKLYDEYKQMCSLNEEDAIMYLEDDWLEDIQYLVSQSRPTRRSTMEGDNGSCKTDLEDCYSPFHQDVSDPDTIERDININKSIEEKKQQPKLRTSDNVTSDIEDDVSRKGNEKNFRKSRKKSYNEYYTDLTDFDESTEVNTDQLYDDITHTSPKLQRKKNINLENEKNEPQQNTIVPVNEEYEVEKILDFRCVTDNDVEKLQYLVRWVGFTEDEDCWVNDSDLQCPNILKVFWKSQDLQKPESVKMNFSKKKSKSSARAKEIPVQKISKGHSIFLKEGGSDKENGGNLLKVLIQQPNRITTGKRGRPKKDPKNVSIQEILNLYDTWRSENQNVLIVGGSNTVNPESLVKAVKKLMSSKGVETFNAESLLSACFMMTLVRMRIKSKIALRNFLGRSCLEVLEANHKQHLTTKEKIRKEKTSTKESTPTIANLQREFHKLNTNLAIAEEERLDSKCALSLVQNEIECIENISKEAELKNISLTSCLQLEVKKVQEIASKSEAEILRKKSNMRTSTSSVDENVINITGIKTKSDADLIETKSELMNYGIKEGDVNGIMKMVMHKIGGHAARDKPQKMEKRKSVLKSK